MNSIKLQDIRKTYRNLLHFYRLIINDQKENKKTNFINNHIKKNQRPRNKFNHGGE